MFLNKKLLKKEYRKVISFCVCVAMTVGVTGCSLVGKKDGNPTESPSPVAKEETKPETTEEIKADIPEVSEENVAAQEEDVAILHPIKVTYENSLTRPNAWENAVSVSWSSFILTGDEATEYDRLSKALVKYTKQVESNVTENFYNMKNSLVSALNYDTTLYEIPYEEYYYNDAGEYEDNWPYYLTQESRNNVIPVRTDSVAFSFVEDYYCYLGGAHPYYAYYPKNFDSQTGYEIMIEDVVKDTKVFYKELKKRLFEEYDYLFKADVETYLEGCTTGEYELDWLLESDGVTVVFNPYSIAAFASGMQVIKIPFDDEADLFTETYQKAPKQYVKPFLRDLTMQEDLNADGVKENLWAYAETGEEEGRYGESFLHIIIEDTEEVFHDYEVYNVVPYMIHTEDGNFLYCFHEGLAYGGSIQFYDLADARVRRIHMNQAGYLVNRGSEWENSDDGYNMSYTKHISYDETFTDPEAFCLGKVVSALSTLGGINQYHVGKDGLPVPEFDYYDVGFEWQNFGNEASFTLTLYTICDLEMMELDEEHQLTGKKVVVPAGTGLVYIRTDNHSFADFRMEDGTEIRAEIMADEWPQYIAGVELEDAFEEVYFAG